jgi:hypothetical protein
MMTTSPRTAPAHLESLAGRLGPGWFSLLVGLVVALVASLAARPAFAPAGQMGILNAELAAAPFGPAPNAMAPRILTPLVSWLLGLRGDGLLILIAICCVLLPAAAARCALGAGHGAGGALLAGGTLGLTLLTRTSLHYGGVTDVVTYLLIFLAWMWRARPYPAAAFFLLALLNHERALFLVPWLWWLLGREAGGRPHGRRDALLGPLLAIGLWLPVRLLILSHREVEHTLGYYLSPLREDPLYYLRMAWPWQALGFLSAFQWVWLLPLVRIRKLWREQGCAGLVGLALPIVCAGGQMFFAYDSSRLAALAFPCLLPALRSGLREDDPFFRRWLGLVLLIQALTPQVFTAGHIVEVMRTWLLPW